MPAYSIAFDCVDRHASHPETAGRTALILVEGDEAGIQAMEQVSFHYLSMETNALAGALRLKARAGSRAVLRLPNSLDFPLAFLACLKAGLIPVPTSSQLTEPELRFILEDSGAALLLTTEDLLPEEIIGNPPGSLDEILKAPFALGEPVVPVATNSDDPAFWLYTSGTAGIPKAVKHAHRNIPAHDERARLWMDLREGDIVFNTSALNWSYALTCGLLDPWRHGATSVVYRGPLKAGNLWETIEELQVTTLMSVPGVYRRLASYLREKPCGKKRLRVVLSAGERLPEIIRKEFREVTGLQIREGLGMTEHSVYLAQAIGDPVREGSCGKPLPGHRVAILREDLSEAAAGEVGVLASHRSCPGLMLGYHRASPEEEKAFHGEWFLSGDMAFCDTEGNFYYVGRRDDVITAGGYRISPLEVEHVLNHLPEVEESAVAGCDVSDGKTIIRAHVVLRSHLAGSDAMKALLIAEAGKNLAHYKVPREIVFVDRLPKTANGKLLRRQLAAYKSPANS